MNRTAKWLAIIKTERIYGQQKPKPRSQPARYEYASYLSF